MKASWCRMLVILWSPLGLACEAFGQAPEGKVPRVSVATVQPGSTTVVQRYNGHVQSQRRIEVRARADGYVRVISVKEGQPVKEGDLLFGFNPVLEQAMLDSRKADVQYARLQYDMTQKLVERKTVSNDELQLLAARLAKATADAKAASVELDFAQYKAPFSGLVGRMQRQEGSFVLKGETLTTLSDNSLVRVYFNVAEKPYLDYMANPHKEDLSIELTLSDGNKYPHPGKIGAIDADFDAKAAGIAFRADFPNPEGLLRHGQSCSVSISQAMKDVILIPQRATFERYPRPYVFVVDKDHVAHRRQVEVEAETGDSFVVKGGLQAGDTIIVDGIRKVEDGNKVEIDEPEPRK